MSDYQRIVEFLRDFRTSGVQVVTDEVREAATAYAAMCATANERLRQCATLIQQGLRAEAVHLAESLPNLLDLVAALDLPDPEGWVELCRRADLPVPPTLQIDRASQIQDAYAQDEPLAQLYAAHRRMALGRAPVIKRLDVMRQIAGADPSPFWDRDIRTFEHARFKEIRVEFAAAMRDRDAGAVTTLSREIRETPWLDTVPADLASAAREVDEHIQSTQNEAEIAEALVHLLTAFTAKSLPECAAILERLKELTAANNGSGLPAGAAEQVRTAATWVHQESRIIARKKAFNEVCTALERALDADASDGELEAAFRAAGAQGQPLPADLHQRYLLTRQGRAQVTRWRYVGLFVGITAVLALGLGIWYWRAQAGIARNWATRIQQATNDHDLEVARQLVEEQERRAPGASSNSEVIAAKHAVAVLADQVEHDRDRVKGILAELQTASRIVAGASGSIEPDKWWPAVVAADEALVRARGLKESKESDPGNLLAPAVTELQNQREGLRNRYAKWVTSEVEAAAQQADADSVAPKAAAIAAAEAGLAAAEQKLAAIRPQLVRADADARSAADAATAKIAQVREAIRHARSEWEALHGLAKSCVSAASARQALQQFAAQFPSSAATPDFARAAAAVDLYESVERWNALSASWAAAPAVANEKAASQRLEVVQDFMREFPQCPLLPRAAAYGEYLKQAADAMATQNTWQREMSEVLSAPLIADLSFVETTDKVRYYVLGDPAVTKQGIGDRVRYVFEAIDPENLARKRTITLPASQKLISEKSTPLPHTLFVRALVEQMKTVDDTNWETWGIGLIDRLAGEQNIDPVARAILLREALQATAHADGWAISGLYDRSISELVRQKLDSICWYDPAHPVSAVTLANLKAIVANVPKGEEARKLVPAGRTALFGSLQPAFSGMGILLQDDDGHWQIFTPPGAQVGESALAIVAPPRVPAPPIVAPPQVPATQPATTAPTTVPVATNPPNPMLPAKLVKVAHKGAKGLVVDEAAAREFPQGTLVLLSKP